MPEYTARWRGFLPTAKTSDRGLSSAQAGANLLEHRLAGGDDFFDPVAHVAVDFYRGNAVDPERSPPPAA
jgi:hypothetical protein